MKNPNGSSSDDSPLTKKRKVEVDDDALMAVIECFKIENIPCEVLFHNIFLFIQLSEVLKLRLTCKYFNSTIVNEWLSAENCSLIPRHKFDERSLIECYNFTNLLVKSYPAKHLLSYYQKFNKVKNLYCNRMVDTYVMKDVVFERLQSLYLNNCELNSADIFLLSQSTHFTQLKTLCFHGNKLRESGNLHLLVNSTVCPNLESLSVSGNELTDDFTSLFDNETSNLPSKLHTLMATSNSMTIQGELTLLYNKQLKILFIRGSQTNFYDLSQPLTLEYLYVSYKFAHNSALTENTKITIDTTENSIMPNGKHFDYTIIDDLVYNKHEKYCENLYASPTSVSQSSLNLMEQLFYVDKCISQHRYNNEKLPYWYEKKKDWDRAINCYKEREEWYGVATVYYNKMKPPNYEKACKYFLKSNSGKHEQVVNCYFQLEEYKKAINYCEHKLGNTLDTMNQEVIEIYGACCYYTKNFLKAVELFSKIETFSKDAYILAYAHALLEVKDETKRSFALELLNNLMSKKNRQVIFMIATFYDKGLYSFEKNEEKAMEYFSKIKFQVNNASYRLAQFYIKKRQNDKALECLTNIDEQYEKYGETCYLLYTLWRQSGDLNKGIVCLTKSIKWNCLNGVMDAIEHLLSSISYDWNFIVDPKYSLINKISFQGYYDIFRSQFTHSTVEPQIDYKLMKHLGGCCSHVEKLQIPPKTKAKIFFLIGKFTHSKKYYDILMDSGDPAAEKYILFYSWLSKFFFIPSINKITPPRPIIDKHLESNIYAQYWYATLNVSINPTKAKKAYEMCKHLFSFDSDFESTLAIETNDDDFVREFCSNPSKLESCTNETMDALVCYVIEKDLIECQNQLLKICEKSRHKASIIPIQCINTKNQNLQIITTLNNVISTNPGIYLKCLKGLSKKSSDTMYSKLLNHHLENDDEIFGCFYSLVVWICFIDGNESRALEFNKELLKSEMVEQLILNKYDPFQLLSDMHSRSPFSVERKIYLKQNPEIAKLFTISKGDTKNLLKLADEINNTN